MVCDGMCAVDFPVRVVAIAIPSDGGGVFDAQFPMGQVVRELPVSRKELVNVQTDAVGIARNGFIRS